MRRSGAWRFGEPFLGLDMRIAGGNICLYTFRPKGKELAMMLVRCEVFPGGFSGEYTFKLKREDGSEHVGLAARQYFWNKDGKPLLQPSEAGVEGYVAVRILDRSFEKDSALISIPDGEVLKINKSRIINVPLSEPIAHVPVGS
jgi:hypothetical protein